MSPPAQQSPAPAFKYWAFISYSHADTKWGRWLHEKMEAYRVPGALIGKPCRDGAVPRRLQPIFLDRQELPVSSDLGANLKNALEQSRYLIVICSPHSAKSRWVDEEARRFKSVHGESRLMCLIVGGEPNATDKGNPAQSECFPEPVRFHVNPDGTTSATRTEPIAADVRPGGDGPHRAKLKMIAGVLGVNFDDLWQREKRRRVRRRVLVVVAILAAMLAIFAGHQWELRLKKIAGWVGAGDLKWNDGRRLLAAGFYARAWHAGERGAKIEERLRNASSALIEPVAILGGEHKDWITFAAFVDATHVVTASWDKTVRLWDLATLASREIVREPDKIASAVFSPDGSRLVTASWNGIAALYDKDGAPLGRFQHAGSRLNWAAFHPDGQRIVTAGDDNTAKIWTLGAAAVAPPLVLQPHDGFVKTAAFSPDGKFVVTSSFDMTAKIWDAATGRRVRSLIPHDAAVNSAAFSPDGKLIATASLDGTVRLWDAAKRDPAPPETPRLFSATTHGKRVNALAFSPDGSLLATAGDDRTAKVWSVSSGELLASFEEHHDIVVHLAFSPDGQRIVSASKDRTAVVFDAVPKKRTMDEIIALADKLAPSSKLE